jgi:hypothetical protein
MTTLRVQFRSSELPLYRRQRAGTKLWCRV